MNHRVILALVFITPIFSFAAEQFVAVIGDVKISLEEFNKRYSEVRAQSINPPTKQVFLEDLVRYKIGLLEAEKRNLKDDPVVKERLQQEVYKALVEKEIGSKVNSVKVVEADMKAWYKNNPEIRTSHILIEVKPAATAEERAAAKKRAEEIYSDVKKSKRSFEELVRLYTDDVVTKAAGGDVGYQTRLTLVPAYYDAALKLKPEQISGLVETEFGFHIIKLTGRHTYEDANKRQIRAAVFEEKRRELFDDLFGKLKAKYKIQTNTSLLK